MPLMLFPLTTGSSPSSDPAIAARVAGAGWDRGRADVAPGDGAGCHDHCHIIRDEPGALVVVGVLETHNQR